MMASSRTINNVILNDDIPVLTVDLICEIEVGFINILGLTKSVVLEHLKANLDPEKLYQCLVEKNGLALLINNEMEKLLRDGNHLLAEGFLVPSTNHRLIKGRYSMGTLAYEINIYPRSTIFSYEN